MSSQVESVDRLATLPTPAGDIPFPETLYFHLSETCFHPQILSECGILRPSLENCNNDQHCYREWVALEAVLLHRPGLHAGVRLSPGVALATVLPGGGRSSNMEHHAGIGSHLYLGSAPFPHLW